VVLAAIHRRGDLGPPPDLALHAPAVAAQGGASPVIFTPAALYGYVLDVVRDSGLARIQTAAALAESGGNTDAEGDLMNGRPTSIGLYQINDIHGLTDAQRRSPSYSTFWMWENEFRSAYQEGLSYGYLGETLARWTCMRAERPYGWNGPGNPGLHSAAADRYAEKWNELAGVSGVAPSPSPPAGPSLQDRLNEEVSYSNALLADCIRPALQALREHRTLDAIHALEQAEEKPV
jgi:hypothetical protein